ncbi:MAG: OFA family MFS transporter [Desulfobulbaceae bacterium]|nr:OFA family MFS transporter [Desulfobulbaceae bacterium]HIJ78651.1 OFA family MFS transporter [Deltaproteobacteria bacterium]
MTQAIRDKGKLVTVAGTGINLALGVLYTWSIFKGAIRQSIEGGGAGAFNWDIASLNDPYAVCCLVFACSMIVAGKCQDTFGPRLTAIVGGLLVGAGFIWISQSTAYLSWVLGFGVLVGMGIAFGYSSATPPALKWFPPNKSGRIAGIVVSGFGLASVYIAPLAQYLLGAWGLSQTMLFFGIAFMVVVSLFSLLLVNPPAGFTPKGFVDRRRSGDAHRQARTAIIDEDLSPGQILSTAVFWRVWFLYFIGAGAGLMVIGSVAGMAKSSMGANAFYAVAILAVGNAAGRIVAGIMADKIGRSHTLAGVFAMQALMMFGAVGIIGAASPSAILLVALATVIGFNYGANLALFPTFAKDLWGMKHFGINYGILFTAWGIGGFVMSKVSQMLRASTGSYANSFIAAGVMLMLGVGLILFMADEKDKKRRQIARELAALGSKT